MPNSSRVLAAFLAFSVILPLACAQGDKTPSTNEPAPVATDPTLPAPQAPPPPTATPPSADEAPIPEVDSVTPDRATVGSVGPNVVITGNNFVARSIVQLEGAPLATTFVSGTELRATIPSSKLSAVGVLRLSVGTSPPGGGASKEITFSVENPVPALTVLNPLSAIAGSGTTTLHVTGTGFVTGSKVVFGATDLVTTYDGATSLDASIPSSLLATSGSFPVKIVNPGPGGGDSTTIAFTVANPNASIQNVTPASSAAGAKDTPIIVTGSGFVAGSTILFNGTSLTTTYTSDTELHATIAASALATAGDFPIVVSNPPPGGGLTAPFTFHVLYPAPTTSNVAPTSVSAGSPPIDITVTGGSFFSASQITLDGAATATTYVDGTHLKATIPANKLTTGGVILVRVVTPPPGGGTSAAVSFSVGNAAPTITSLSPGSVTAGSGNTNVTLNGAGFLASTSATSNGVNVVTTYLSPSTVTVTVPSSQLGNAGQVALAVANPAPGGGTSNTVYLYVGCDTSGVDVSLNAVGQTISKSTSFAGATQMGVFTGASSCAATAISTTTNQPGRYWVVQNVAAAPITISTWAVCTGETTQDDAFLTFYRRPTPPASDTERLACENVVSEGNGGTGTGYLSPEAGPSTWCPGLTKANGGGITLNVCEKAIVHMQPYSMTSSTYTPPPTIRFKAE
jgi:hypothetical protein